MQRQRFAGDGTDPFAQVQEDLKVKPIEIQIPDVHEAMQLAGVKDLVLDPKEKRKRLLCCCGERGCGIGPMTQVEES